MVDGGAPGEIKRFEKELKNIDLNPSDVELIIVTHGHIDHIGSLKDLKDLTGAKVAVHRLDVECVEKGEWTKSHQPNIFAPWGRVLELFKMPLLTWMFLGVPSTEVEIIVQDEGFSLLDFGISGHVYHTPGHTDGSISVLLDSGQAFVGDLAMNKFPLRRTPGLPTLGTDLDKVKESWKLLLGQGVETVYPGHGEPFPVDVIEKSLK